MLWTAYKEGHTIGNSRQPQAHSLQKVKTSVLLLQGNESCQQHIWAWRQIHPQLSLHCGKEPTCQCRRYKRWGLNPRSGRSPEEGMPTHFSILAWRIPWTEEPGVLQSMGSQSRTWLKPLSIRTQCRLADTLTVLWAKDLSTGSSEDMPGLLTCGNFEIIDGFLIHKNQKTQSQEMYCF